MSDTSNQQGSPVITTNKTIKWVFATNHKNPSKKSSPTLWKNSSPYSEAIIITRSSILRETVFAWVLEGSKNQPQEAIDRSSPATSRTWTSMLVIAKKRSTWRTRPLLSSNKRQSRIRWSASLSMRKRKSEVNSRWSLFSTTKRRSFSRKSWRISSQKMQLWRRKFQQCKMKS